MRAKFSVKSLGLLLAFGGIISVVLIVVACRSCNPPGPATQVPTFRELDSAYCELVDIRGRAQRELREDPQASYLDMTSFTNAYPDKRLGLPMHNGYTIVADFSFHESVSNPVPPVLSFPRELMGQFPFEKYPVFLMRPQDNDFQHVMHLVRVAFLNKQEVDSMVSGSSFSLKTLEQPSAIPERAEHPVWDLYSQEHIFNYLNSHEDR